MFRAQRDQREYIRRRGNLRGIGQLRPGQLHRHRPIRHQYAGQFVLWHLDRWRFRKAWKAYHGGSEKHPDWFVRYCLPDKGTELLIHRLETLRNAANQT